MIKISIPTTSLIAVTVLTAASNIGLAADNKGASAMKPDASAKIERGRYVVTVSGCNDCHTPLKMGSNGPEPDMERMLSGHPESLVMPAPPQLPDGPWQIVSSSTSTAWSGPWGVSFTANLTPDRETGLGKWSLRTFVQTIRTGRHKGRGREVLPPMPIPMYKHFSDDDLAAIFAYLQSIPAVKNRVPEPVPPSRVMAMDTKPATAAN